MIPSSYPDASEIARLSARMLLEIKAVHFNAEDPFTLASFLHLLLRYNLELTDLCKKLY